MGNKSSNTVTKANNKSSISNRLTMNRNCYCRGTLVPYEKPCDGRICTNCCNSISNNDKMIYLCLHSSCFYQQTSTQTYIISHGCYNTSINDNDYKNDEQEEDLNVLILNKFLCSIKIIN